MEELGINRKFFTPSQVKPLASVAGNYTYFADGDVLLAKITPCFENGKLGIASSLHNAIGFGSSEFIVLRPSPKLDKEFLYYYLLRPEFRSEGEARMGGAVGQQRVPKEFVENYLIPLPPISEQRHIVGILDKAFAAIATAETNTENNLHNAHAIFDRRLQAVFAERGKDWTAPKFGDIVESTLIGLTRSSREQGDDRPYKYVKMNNITSDNCFDFSSFVRVDASDEETRRFRLRAGDFLFNTRNSVELVGKACIYEGNPNEVVLFNNNIMRVRFKKCIEPKFVLLALSSTCVAHDLNALKSGTTNVAAVYYGRLKSLNIPLPPCREQKEITAALMRFREESRRLESVYVRKLALLGELRKSLLQQAFSGSL